jgi:hypothetical protein
MAIKNRTTHSEVGTDLHSNDPQSLNITKIAIEIAIGIEIGPGNDGTPWFFDSDPDFEFETRRLFLKGRWRHCRPKLPSRHFA